MKVAILGAGAIGCYLGGVLKLSGIPVTLIGREAIKHSIIENSGITITDYLGRSDQVMPDEFLTDDLKEQYDCVFITVKCHTLPLIVESLNCISNKKSTLIFMQNGIGSLSQIREQLVTNNIYQGITPFNVLQQDKAKFHQATEGHFIFAECPATKFIQSKLLVNQFECELSTDMESVIYGKLLLNLNNALNAISDCPIKEELENPVCRQILATAMSEWLLVSKKRQVSLKQFTKVPPSWLPKILRLPNALFRLLARSMLAIDPTARSSMWEDIKNRRKTEVDFINGAVVRLGRELNIATPVNESIVNAIKKLELGDEVSLDDIEL
ncbi:2-dehydropantoate 2-reductase [Pleionea sediminis]|uniref:2-dehydropantoate 2-reductase n=1 Tax=Pleionea sediminis TaxID=2569479 RepID=UPI001185159F|nr:2-dehydropantoate 2-reductase [Pleionea sediminis]